ncbi:hypothetical protein PMG71_03215 [Roseofilum sp. BLCC_M154]|jgi:hypothetical protein|uniref:Uncharacterized protein n=1 Tax=Roseofilum acuticapitatum BLCC-M154 TaxID=3022444 RepID=A0ABT7ANG4_9CYAN|nr:hypothetical protein [Roseofilum acuticapitatum]MDJ1168432.1 hypothetical protein [Roseofilum acuticapitatum BLCC-M154]
MKSPSLPERAIGGIKTVSTLLMSGAIALESYNLIDPFISPSLPIGVTGLIILERIAVSIHLLEAIAAAYLAPSRQQHPLKTCIYTFFVGTVGLWELLATPRTGE